MHTSALPSPKNRVRISTTSNPSSTLTATTDTKGPPHAADGAEVEDPETDDEPDGTDFTAFVGVT